MKPLMDPALVSAGGRLLRSSPQLELLADPGSATGSVTRIAIAFLILST